MLKLFGLVLLVLPGCVDILDGNGVPGEDERELPEFERIVTQGNLDLMVTEGAFAVTVHIDENLVERVSTTVSGDTLDVEVEGGNLGEFLDGPHVIISMPELTGAELRGGGSVTATGFDGGGSVLLRALGAGRLSWTGRADEIGAGLEGTAEVTLSGRADAAVYYVRGTGTLDARDLTAQAADIEVDGDGTLSATVDGQVDARARVGSIELFGDVIEGTWSVTDEGSIDAN
jgi:hypothetical protein